MPLPPDSKFNFRAPLKRYKELRDNLLGYGNYDSFHGSLRDGAFSEEAYQDFIHRVYKLLMDPITLDDPDDVDPDYIVITPDACEPFQKLMLGYYGQKLSAEQFSNLLWRLACGVTEFRAGRELAPSFEPGAPPAWLPLWVEDIRPTHNSNNGRAMLALSVRVLEGRYAGLSVMQRMPQKWVLSYLARELGFPRYDPVAPTELVQCVFAAELDFSDERFGPSLSEIAVTKPMKAFTQQLRKARKSECPRNYKHLCYQCHAGHGIGDSERHAPPCPRACHSQSYIALPCPRCKRDSMFDVSSRSPICVRCAVAENKAKMKVSS